MTNLVRVAVVSLLAVVVCGCNNFESPVEPGEPTGPLAMETLYIGKFSGVSVRGGEVVRSATRWNQVWIELHGEDPLPPLPQIDFSRDMVIVAATGYNPDSCFSATITKVAYERRSLTVSVADERLPSSCFCPPFAVRPAHAVKVRRVDGSAVFEFARVTVGNSC